MSEAEAPSVEAVADEAPSSGNPWLRKLKVAGILSAIVVVQCFLAYLYLPGGGESTANASSKTEHAADEPAHHGPTKTEQSEVDLGAFSLTVFNPNSNNNLLVDFHLFGTVVGETADPHAEKDEHAETTDAAKLEKLLKGHRHRFRDQVIATVRNSQITDLADPGLGLLKRQILTKTNNLLGEPLLKEVIFSDFVVVEQ
jgi:flagellar FliL protein